MDNARSSAALACSANDFFSSVIGLKAFLSINFKEK
jgi:hypothetical protein